MFRAEVGTVIRACCVFHPPSPGLRLHLSHPPVARGRDMTGQDQIQLPDVQKAERTEATLTAQHSTVRVAFGFLWSVRGGPASSFLGVGR